jgi:hypothetical protein
LTTFVSMLKQGVGWLVVDHPEAFLMLVLPILGAVIGSGITSYFSLRFWSWIRWKWICHEFRKHRHKPCKARIVTMEDYVFLLERLRSAIIAHYRHKKVKPKIIVHVFTMQLPSDWPLWDTERKAEDGGMTALENYYFNFHSFLKDGKKDDGRYTVEVKRVIVVDAYSSPKGQRRYKALVRDVNKPYFAKYIEMLHLADADAVFHTTDRPWPGWLADAVFYGVDDGKTRRWLWAVTTSFNSGEDLILLRHHRLCGRDAYEHLPLPAELNTLTQLAEEAAGRTWTMHQLSTLKRPAPAAKKAAASKVPTVTTGP